MGMPVVGVSPTFTRAGAVAAFFADYRNNGEQAGQVAVKLLDGESLQKIPVIPPTKIGSSFNLSVARHLNRAVNSEALKGASDVVR